jgi:hypothetical protein
MDSVFASNAVDRGFEHQSGQTKDNKIGICCLSTKHAALRRKNKDWFARTQDAIHYATDVVHRKLMIGEQEPY